MTELALSRIDTALEAYRAGRFVIIVDDEDRENEGDLVIAADHITPDAVNFMATHGHGLICLAMRGALLDRLKIPMMVPDAQNRSGFGTGFTVSVEAASGVSTGISAADRSHTIRTLINPATTPVDIAMPGHIFPLRARDGGVLERRGQTEASVDLSVLGGLTPAGVICEVMANDGTMMRLPELCEFAGTHDIPVISVEQLVHYRREQERKSKHRVKNPNGNQAHAAHASAIVNTMADASVTRIAGARIDHEFGSVARVAESRLPTEHGDFRMVVFRDQQGLEHSALLMGDVSAGAPMTRLHSECLTGDTFGSLRCDCGEQLKRAMSLVADEGCGVILYMRQEGRGIGLGNKIKAYALQDTGFDTVDANHVLGFPADARTYDVAANILSELGINTIRLLSNNPEKGRALEKLGIHVEKELPLRIPPQEKNLDYLQTKASRMEHTLDIACKAN